MEYCIKWMIRLISAVSRCLICRALLHDDVEGTSGYCWLNKFRVYLMGRIFEVITDHQGLRL